ncbi:PAP2 family protein, partial [Poseidonibacter ostreae]
IYALSFALTVGWSMGTYKMLIGDHFLSHTIITMLIAWLLVLIIYKIINSIEKEKY